MTARPTREDDDDDVTGNRGLSEFSVLLLSLLRTPRLVTHTYLHMSSAGHDPEMRSVRGRERERIARVHLSPSLSLTLFCSTRSPARSDMLMRLVRTRERAIVTALPALSESSTRAHWLNPPSVLSLSSACTRAQQSTRERCTTLATYFLAAARQRLDDTFVIMLYIARACAAAIYTQAYRCVVMRGPNGQLTITLYTCLCV